jgi:hypothetical protein
MMVMVMKATNGEGNEGNQWRGQEVGMISTWIEMSECEVGRSCLTITQTEEKGMANLPSPQWGQTERIYMQMRQIGQVCYKQCELIKMKKEINLGIVLPATGCTAQ